MDAFMCISLLIVLPLVEASVFNLGILVPITGRKNMGREVYTAIEISVDRINTDPDLTVLRQLNHTFQYVVEDTACNVGLGLFEFAEMVTQKTLRFDTVHAFIGPACNDVCLPVGLLAGRWRVPMVSFGCESNILSNKEDYPTFVRSTGTFSEMSAFLEETLLHFNWRHLTLISGHQTIWVETVADFQHEFQDHEFEVQHWILYENTTASINRKLLQEATHTRVFIICAYAEDIAKVMDAALYTGLMTGSHVFISVDYANMANKIKINETVHNKNDTHNGLLDITIDVMPESEVYQNFLLEMEKRINIHIGSYYEHGIHLALLADSIYLYAVALNRSLADNTSAIDGISMADHIYGITVAGITGPMHIQQDGSRLVSYMLHNLVNGKYRPISRSGLGGHGFIIVNETVVWPGGGTQVPTDHPECGWNEEHCPDMSTLIALCTVSAIVVSLIGVIVVGHFIRKRQLKRASLERLDWKIPSDKLIPGDNIINNSLTSKLTLNRVDGNSGASTTSMHTDECGASFISSDSQIFTSIARYDGNIVALKHIYKPCIALTANIITEINTIRNLTHDNINHLVGACLDPKKLSLVWSYCHKGSLQDVLQNDHIKLDWIFKFSFISDIITGMIYLHGSGADSHGRLKSSNVLVDSHWACRIADMAMPHFREGERPPIEDDVTISYQLLWTAPEILRNPEKYPKGTKMGDVYSFGIILQEIVLRTLPFGDDSHEPQDIVTRVSKPEKPPLRPSIPPETASRRIIELMRACWEEVPTDRPTFTRVMSSYRKVNKGTSVKLVDQMVHMLSKQAEHLEELVHDRTIQLEAEKNKTDELLCRMLPRYVVEELKKGNQIEPESFNQATILFSDIVGFTSLSAKSTPYEVVNFLNDLYTCFDTIIDTYDVYKVETIGDAYMVVSGLPVRNGSRHAVEIANMSLDLLSAVFTFTIRHIPNKQLQVRIGIHSGPVVAGVVGLKMPRYCLFGDTVNYASRMESSGLASRIHVSPESKDLLEECGDFHLMKRGIVTMKGKGAVETYFLQGKTGFDRELPSVELTAPVSERIQ